MKLEKNDAPSRESEPIAKESITATLVRKLISSQFPQWQELTVCKVVPGGWDNVTFRLGEELLVRLPSATRYAPQVEKEQRWLPLLSNAILFNIPSPVAMGLPSKDFPWNWSIYKWIPGEVGSKESVFDEITLANDIVQFLTQLHACTTVDAPHPGAHNFYRGGALHVYEDETYSLLRQLDGIIDTDAVGRIFARALKSEWKREPVWVHGDFSASNILVSGSRLKAVIDFGSSAVGDPACDTAIAWTFFGAEARTLLTRKLNLDEATWERGKGWVLWKSMLLLANNLRADQSVVQSSKAIIEQIIVDG